MMVGMIIYALIAEPDHQIFVNLWRPDWAAFGRVLALGTPISLTMLAEVGLFTASSVMVGWTGTLPLAAHGIVLQVAGATFMIHLGLANVGTIRAARAFGAGDIMHLRRGAIVVTSASAFIAFATMAVFIAIPGTLIGLFLAPDNLLRGDIIAAGSILLVIMGCTQIADAMQAIMVGLLRGVQDTAVPMTMAAISYWGIGAPVAYVLSQNFGMGAPGVWLGLCVGLGVAAILLSYRFWITAPWKVSTGS
jgi:MATE family multidrug resistance protein